MSICKSEALFSSLKVTIHIFLILTTYLYFFIFPGGNQLNKKADKYGGCVFDFFKLGKGKLTNVFIFIL
jgi:hypothetical protein